MNNITYYVITRFNVRIFDGRVSREKNIRPERDRLSENYLNERFDFFEKHTYLAVCNQTCKNFKWIIMFHDETPDIFKKRVESLKVKCSHIVPLYVPDNRVANDVLRDFLEKDCKTDWVATSRIDNDDEYMPEFMETLQSLNFLEKAEHIVSFPDGLIYDNKKKLIVKRYRDANNCITLFARRDSSINHSLALDHSKVCDADSKYKVHLYRDGKPKWVINIHSLNLANTTKYRFRNMILDRKFLMQCSYVNIKSFGQYCIYIIRVSGLSFVYTIWDIMVWVRNLFR